MPDPVARDLEDEEVLRISDAILLGSLMRRDRALLSMLLHGLWTEEVCRLNVEDYVNGEVPLTELCIQDLDAYSDWRRVVTWLRKREWIRIFRGICKSKKS